MSCFRFPRILALSSVAVLTLSRPGLAQPIASPPPPNILLIVADDLGYGDIGCFGQEQIQTPNIDQLARDGTRFTQFYAGSTVCSPSRNVLITGQHVGHVLVRGNQKIDLRPEDLTIAEVLRPAGYTSATIGKWGLGKIGSTGTPLRQGFDFFFGFNDQSHAHNHYPHFLYRNDTRINLPNVVPDPGPYGQGVSTNKVVYAHDLFTEETLKFIDRSAPQPFFLYLAYTLPHANDEAGDEGMEVPDYGIYSDRDWPEPQKGLAAMITRLDRDVGRIVAKLDELGLTDNTVVVFTSDNGPHREGGNDPGFFDSNGPLKGIKRDLYEGGIRVPTIVKWPDHTPAGATSEHVAYFGDFMATAADLAGAETPPHTDSISFAPILRGTPAKQKEHEYLYWEFYEGGSAQAVRWGKWKGIRQPMFTGDIELYDLTTDLGEEHNVAAEQPDVVARITAIMAEAHEPSDLWQVRR